jgi:hypothetical protein
VTDEGIEEVTVVVLTGWDTKPVEAATWGQKLDVVEVGKKNLVVSTWLRGCENGLRFRFKAIQEQSVCNLKKKSFQYKIMQYLHSAEAQSYNSRFYIKKG